MSYGYEIRNAAGQIIVDPFFRSFSVVQSGTKSPDTSVTVSGNTIYRYFISFSGLGDFPLFMVKMPTFVSIAMESHTSTSLTLLTLNYYDPLQWIIAGKQTSNTLAESYGIAVYNEYGTLLYDSTRPYLSTIVATALSANMGDIYIPHNSAPLDDSYFTVPASIDWVPSASNLNKYKWFYQRQSATSLYKHKAIIQNSMPGFTGVFDPVVPLMICR